MPSLQIDIEQERTHFEQWASSKRYDLTLCGKNSAVGPADAYFNTATAHAWEVWLERASRVTPQVTDEYRVKVEDYASKAGWVSSGHEGALEFITRTLYELGKDDATVFQTVNLDNIKLPEPDHYDTNMRRNAWSESLVRQAIKNAVVGKQLPIVLELPDDDNRTVKTWWDEIKDGKRHLCISVDVADAGASKEAHTNEEEDSVSPRVTKEMWDTLRQAHEELIDAMRRRQTLQLQMNRAIAPLTPDEIKMLWRLASENEDSSLAERLHEFARRVETYVKSMRAEVM